MYHFEVPDSLTFHYLFLVTKPPACLLTPKNCSKVTVTQSCFARLSENQGFLHLAASNRAGNAGVWCEFLVVRLPENEHTPWKINISKLKRMVWKINVQFNPAQPWQRYHAFLFRSKRNPWEFVGFCIRWKSNIVACSCE